MKAEDKVRALFDALWPLLEERLQAEGVIRKKGEPKPRRPRMDVLIGKLYMPEVDYMVSMYRLRSEIRHAALVDGSIRLTPVTSKDHYYYAVGAHGTGEDGEFKEMLIIPSMSLRAAGVIVNEDMRRDFRVGKAVTYYAGNLRNDRGEKLKGSTSCYPVVTSMHIDKEVIDTTKKYWQSMTKEESERKIIDKDHMIETLNILEQGQISVGQQVGLWRVLEDSLGNLLTAEEAGAMHPMDPRRLSPRKIVPTWFGDDV